MLKIRTSKTTGWDIIVLSNFMPDTGKLAVLHLPESNDNIRVETGIRQGDEITVYYDPLIAKVIAYGSCRREALCRLDQALQDFLVAGVRTNIPFIRKILKDSDFQAGAVTTAFIEQHKAKLFSKSPTCQREVALACALRMGTSSKSSRSSTLVPLSLLPWDLLDNFSGFVRTEPAFNVRCGNDMYSCRVQKVGPNKYDVQVSVQVRTLYSF